MCEKRGLCLNFLSVAVLLVLGCAKASVQEHEAGVFLSKSLKSFVCQADVKDFTSPCGSFDVRYEASPKELFINVYGIHAPNEILEVVTQARKAKEAKEIHINVTINFYRNLTGHSLVRSEIIGG